MEWFVFCANIASYMPYGYVYQNIVHVLYCYVTTNEFLVDLASRIDQN